MLTFLEDYLHQLGQGSDEFVCRQRAQAVGVAAAYGLHRVLVLLGHPICVPGMNRLLLPLIPAVLFVLAPRQAAACSCEPPGSPQEELASHDAVLAGRVVEILAPADLALEEDVLVTFDVSSVWKGEAEQVVAVTTGRHGGVCGYPFRLGEQYVVYGNLWEGGLHTGLCTRTNTLDAATEDTQQLGDPIAVWPLDDTNDCCGVPEILGRWHTDSDEEYVQWHILEFRSDGVCVANMILPELILVTEFPYAKERTLLFGAEKRDKVVFGANRSTYVNRGDGWTAEHFEFDHTRFFFTLGHGDKLTAYPYEHDWASRAARYTRTDRPIYSGTSDGRVTSVAAVSWGEIKGEAESNP